MPTEPIVLGPNARIEAATRADLAAIGRLAYATAFFGAPADVFFPTPTLFAELWVAPYLVAGHVLVARQGSDLHGYCLGVDRSVHYLRGLWRRTPHVLRALLHDPGRARALRFGVRALTTPRPTAPARRFPAHLHLAVAVDARGVGLGRRLLQAYLQAARDRGVVGVQLATTDLHAAAVRLYHSEGFDTWAERDSRLWRPWLGRDLRHLVMTLDLTCGDPTRATTPAAGAPD